MTKKLEEKTIDSYSSYVHLFGFYTQQNVNSAANFVFTSKTVLPRVVLVLRWVLFFQKYSSLLSRSLNNICTVAIWDRYWLVNAVGEPYSCPTGLTARHNPKPQPGHFNNSTRRPRSEKPLQTSGSRTFLSFSCFSIANQEAVSRSAALLLRINALALQKRPFFVLFALADVAMLCAVEGAHCKTRESP